ncbi:MAG: RNA methyltransferase [Pseudomonadota bacterium]
MADIFMALVHHPVYNKNREVIVAALTTLDLHDLARLAATYGLAGFYLVTPLEDQLEVAEDMIEHWCRGWGAGYNSTRAEAFALVRLGRSLEEVKAEVEADCGLKPVVVGTSAKDGPGRFGFAGLAEYIKGPQPLILVFGTAWGLTQEVLGRCDLVLESIKGPTEYNHLSVRSAVGITLDRLLGRT